MLPISLLRLWLTVLSKYELNDKDPFNSYGNPTLRTGITLYVPEAAVEAYKKDSYWGSFKEVLPMPNKCEKPAITFVENRLKYHSDTEDVKFKTTISREFDGNDILVDGTYTVTVVATKEGYEDSDAATYTIEMSEGSATLKGDIDGNGKVDIVDVTSLIDIVLGK